MYVCDCHYVLIIYVVALVSAVQVAKRSRDHIKPNALIAGSLSTHMPRWKGTAPPTSIWPSGEKEYAAYVEAATALTLAGVDLLFVEMYKVTQSHVGLACWVILRGSLLR